jgi:hypothetical protein
MEASLNVPKGHVIIDTDLYFELLQRFGTELPSKRQHPYEKESEMSIKILVNTQKEKDDIIKQSAYIHGLPEADIAEVNILAHIFVAPDCIEVHKPWYMRTPMKGSF